MPNSLSPRAQRVLRGHGWKQGKKRLHDFSVPDNLAGELAGALDANIERFGVLAIGERTPVRFTMHDRPSFSLKEGEEYQYLRVGELYSLDSYIARGPRRYWTSLAIRQPLPCYLTADGAIYVENHHAVVIGPVTEPRPWEDNERKRGLFQLASSLQLLLEKVAVIVEASVSNGYMVRVRGRVGRHLATRFGATLISEASDAVHEFWSAPGVLIQDGELYGRDANQTWIYFTQGAHGTLVKVLAELSSLSVTAQIAVSQLSSTRYYAPAEAPDPTPFIERARHRIPLQFEHAEEDGWIFVDDESPPTVHQVRTHHGRILWWDRYRSDGNHSDNYCLAVEHFRSHLSESALHWVRKYHVTHNPQLQMPLPLLRTELERRGMTPVEPLLELEEMLGGVAIRGRDLEWLQPFGFGLNYDELDRLVLSQLSSLLGDEALMADPTGRLYGGDSLIRGGMLAESWKTYLERLAVGCDGIQVDAELGEISSAYRPYELWVDLESAFHLQRLLNVPTSEELSDRAQIFACAENIRIWFLMATDEWNDGAFIQTSSLEKVVEILRVPPQDPDSFLSIRCTSWSGSEPFVPIPDEVVRNAESYPVVQGVAYVSTNAHGYQVDVVTTEGGHRRWDTLSPRGNIYRDSRFQS